MFVDKESLKPKRFSRQEKDAFFPYLDVKPMDEIDLLPKSPRVSASLKRSNE
jgi:hypothetical protein